MIYRISTCNCIYIKNSLLSFFNHIFLYLKKLSISIISSNFFQYQLIIKFFVVIVLSKMTYKIIVNQTKTCVEKIIYDKKWYDTSFWKMFYIHDPIVNKWYVYTNRSHARLKFGIFNQIWKSKGSIQISIPRELEDYRLAKIFWQRGPLLRVLFSRTFLEFCFLIIFERVSIPHYTRDVPFEMRFDARV